MRDGFDSMEVQLTMQDDHVKYRLTFEMPEALHDQLRQTAHDLNLDRSKLIRKALVLGLAQIRGLPGLAHIIDAVTADKQS